MPARNLLNFPPFHRRLRCQLFAFATALCWIFIVSNAVVHGAPPESSGPTISGSESQVSGVVEITSRSFGSLVGNGDGNVWLIEFYTPSCSHCVDFEESYQRIAKILHTNPDDKIRVGRVNCSTERSLMNRFDIDAFPSFYLVDGWKIYEFKGRRGRDTLIEFARGGYKKKKPIPFAESAFGPMGLTQGTLIYLGSSAVGVLEYLEKAYGVSPIISAVVICSVGVTCGMITIVLLTFLSMPSEPEKID